MDDLAIVLRDANSAQVAADKITETASSLYITFNIKKCGEMNVNHEVIMNMEPISAMPNYKYLGAWTNSENLVGMSDAFNLVKADCNLVMNERIRNRDGKTPQFPNPGNFKPIALSKVSYKLLTCSVITKRLSNWLDNNKEIYFGHRALFLRGVKENTLWFRNH